MTTLLERPTILAAGRPPRPFEPVEGMPRPDEHDAGGDPETPEEV